MSMNKIYLRRRLRVVLKEGEGNLPAGYLGAMQKNLASLGFVLSPALADRVRTLSLERLESFYKSLEKDLQEMVGAHRVLNPFYPNFPAQVMEASEAELYLNAVMHYLTNELPSFKKKSREELADKVVLRVVDLGTKEDFEAIFKRLAGSATSLSANDKLDLAWFVAQYRDDISRLMPATMTMKENIAFLGAQLIRNTSVAEKLLAGRIKTATDVLRLAVALSDGDVSLAKATKFLKFPRRERKQLLGMLEKCGEPTEDMLRWQERWKRLGEFLHPGDYAEQFPKTLAAFKVIREDAEFSTFRRGVEKHLLKREIPALLEMLEERPGELARRLDHLLRLGGDGQRVLEVFEKSAGDVSTPVLLQVMTHFENREVGAEKRGKIRAFFPKGDVAKVFAIVDELPALGEGLAGRVVGICRRFLVERFRKLPALGKCYLDEGMANFLVPFSQRSASKSLRTLVRGSRLKLPETKAIRFFLWWRNGSSRTDIDLSAVFFNEKYRYMNVVAYYNLKNIGGHHSGDIVDAPKGAAEFIDLDIERTRAFGVRYVVMSINSYTAQPYCDLPECFAGWMGREEVNSGEVFEARTVQEKIDVASDTSVCIPLVLDLEKREVLWCDLALQASPRWNNVRNNLSGVSLMLIALSTLVKTNLHTLFSLHIEARGRMVREKADADQVFSEHEGITPFDLERIGAEFL